MPPSLNPGARRHQRRAPAHRPCRRIRTRCKGTRRAARRGPCGTRTFPPRALPTIAPLITLSIRSQSRAMWSANSIGSVARRMAAKSHILPNPHSVAVPRYAQGRGQSSLAWCWRAVRVDASLGRLRLHDLRYAAVTTKAPPPGDASLTLHRQLTKIHANRRSQEYVDGSREKDLRWLDLGC